MASRWLLAPGPVPVSSHCAANPGQRYFLRIASRDTGFAHRCCMCTARWSSRFSPTAGRLEDHRHPDPLQHVRRADARELQHVRGAHGAAAEHDLTREHALLAAGPLAVGDADRAGARHDHPADLDPAPHLEVGARADRAR